MSSVANKICNDRLRSSDSFLHVCCYVIAVISIYDAFLAFYYRQFIVERNPICQWLMDLEPTYFSVFLIAKTMGTLAVVAIIIVLTEFKPDIGLAVAKAVTIFQVGLILYLHLAFI